ncbi:hypothetical protein ACN9MJ_13100 [Acidovorax facilis]|uniref:hypothetical protein n=1 Tax=Acidovorax facilis TaxID=12917 RepID=UPI003CEA7F39
MRDSLISYPRARKPSGNFRDADFFNNLGIAHFSSHSHSWFLSFISHRLACFWANLVPKTT